MEEGATCPISRTPRPNPSVVTLVHRLPLLRSWAGPGLFLATIMTAACTGRGRAGGAEAAVLSGTLLYRPRIALPSGAVVGVWLQDLGRADAPATVAEDMIATGERHAH